ncbi:16S rRNA (guanine(527)-N(7))-methyltransferase RsmG [Falsochrobactrum shanghaiense]|uniref:Ribosomal RNA small subunit methyltransferase G n=1 Tax=Falsochrobactrum shanghaiense TaxID=2201899 RepID=A0A316JDP3_9HYPH|nr:16S rRNA (guanine(527)-N(7))-methyltransferase RsmG [Falsochrobactrum shanghaiense]PWL19566.1 16S rRNA (guanine(527)-N(7))-methyltransferase RsmG [Falsochrobactrum shanghaiense]
MSADRGFETLRAVVPSVSRETAQRLMEFEALFRKWSKAINLASPSTLADLWNRHILDSAQIFPLAPQATRWLDLGSGGGFPGIVTACFLKDVPGASIDLIESAGKKAAFLRTAAGQLDIPARVHAVRIEAMRDKITSPEIITARALASLTDLFTLAEPWLTNGSKALFQKGRDYQREIDESRVGWRYDLVQHQSTIDPASVILEISNLRRAGS